jgi:hypothetical protein
LSEDEEERQDTHVSLAPADKLRQNELQTISEKRCHSLVKEDSGGFVLIEKSSLATRRTSRERLNDLLELEEQRLFSERGEKEKQQGIEWAVKLNRSSS